MRCTLPHTGAHNLGHIDIIFLGTKDRVTIFSFVRQNCGNPCIKGPAGPPVLGLPGLAFSRPKKKQIWPFKKFVGLEIYLNL